MRAILVDVPDAGALQSLLERGAEDRELGDLEGQDLREGEWLTVEVRVGKHLTRVPAHVRDLGEGPRIVLQERDWLRLQSFASCAGQKREASLPKSGVTPIVRGHVLVASAERAVGEVLERTLQAAGFCTTSVTSTEEVMARLALCSVQLLVVDNHLPDGTALGLCTALQALPSDARPTVLVLIACSSHEGRAVLEAGADDFLVTPCRQQELVARVTSLLHADGDGRMSGAA